MRIKGNLRRLLWLGILLAGASLVLAGVALSVGSIPTATAAISPVINSVSPPTGPPAGGSTVTITGSGLTGTNSVTFGQASASYAVDSDNQITATSPPGSGTTQITVTTPAGSATGQFVYTAIQHIVVMDMENHSFDNVLGFWCQNNPRCGTGDAMPASVTLSNGTVVTPSVDGDVVPAQSHTVQSQVNAMDGGKMDGWQNEQYQTCSAAKNYGCVSGYTPSQIPNITSLAQDFAINDRFFESMDSPSWGGHVYAVAGTLDGFTGDNPVPQAGTTPRLGWGCDSDRVAKWAAGGAFQPACIPDFALGLPNGGAFEPTKALNVPTIMDRLGAVGLTWRIYGAKKTSKAGPGGQYSGYIWSVCPSFAECLDTGQDANLVDQSQFFADASAGTLPSFSLITAGGQGIGASDSCHNGFSMTACDNYVGQVASAVLNSPQWSSTVLLITWDDFGGFYDSQPPPGLNPDGTQQGIRLPLIAVSPFANPESTDSTPATFASILAFVEHTFGLPALEQDDSSAYDLSGMFTPGLSLAHLGQRPRMVTRPVPKGDRIDWAQAGQDT